MAGKYTDRQLIENPEIETYLANIADPDNLQSTVFWLKEELRRIERASLTTETLLRALSSELLSIDSSSDEGSTVIDDGTVSTQTTWSSSKIADGLNSVEGEKNTSSNAGSGVGLALPKSGVTLPFKSIAPGDRIDLSDDGSTVTVSSPSELDDTDVSYDRGWSSAKIKSAIAQSAGGGEKNTSSNAGSGVGLALPKSGEDLPFKSIIAGDGVTVVDDLNDITIDTVFKAVVDDTDPHLGGDLNADGHEILDVHHIEITGQDIYGTGTALGSNFPAFVGINADHYWNYTVPSFPAPALIFPSALEFSGVQTVQKSMGLFGGGFLLYNHPTIKGDPSLTGIALSGIYTLASDVIYQADSQAVTCNGAVVDVTSKASFVAINGGTLNGSAATFISYLSSCEVGAGATLGSRIGMNVNNASGAGALGSQVGIAINALTKGTTGNVAILLGAATPPAGNWSVYQSDETGNRWNGSQQYKWRPITANRVLDSTDHAIYGNNTGSIEVTLATAAANNTGAEYLIFVGNTGAITVVPPAGQTLNGSASTYVMIYQYQWLRVQSTGSAWVITAHGLAPPANTFGPELILNGGFTDGSSWNPNNGWAIAGGVASITSAATNAFMNQPTAGVFLAGRTYRVTYTASGYSGTNGFRFQFTTPQTNGTTRTADGTYTQDITILAGSAPTFFSLAAFTGTSVTIDDVSAVEILT